MLCSSVLQSQIDLCARIKGNFPSVPRMPYVGFARKDLRNVRKCGTVKGYDVGSLGSLLSSSC